MTTKARAWFWYWIAWIPFAVIYAIMTAMPVSTRIQRPIPPLPLAFVEGLTYVAPVAIMGVVVWWLVGRLAWPPRSTWRFIAVHVAVGTVFSILWLSSQVALFMM
jgi:hypothetical protein